MAERISIEEMLGAPQYAMEMADDMVIHIHHTFHEMLVMAVELGRDISRVVPPDYRKNVSVVGSETVDGRSTAMIAVLPDSSHGLSLMVNLTFQEKECDHEHKEEDDE